MAIVSLRTDRETDAALDELGDKFGNRTDTLKAAILRLAEEVRGNRLREESRAAANDPDDLAETKAVMADMDELRAW
jgi:hypothetical protein